MAVVTPIPKGLTEHEITNNSEIMVRVYESYIESLSKQNSVPLGLPKYDKTFQHDILIDNEDNVIFNPIDSPGMQLVRFLGEVAGE